MGRRLRDSRTADLAVLAGTDPVERGDVVELDTPAGALTVKKGAGSGSTAFVGVALHSASPGETIQVFRSGLLDFVKVKDGVALPAGVLLGWEANTVRVFDSVNDFAVIGRALDASPGGTDQVVQAEIWFPPNLKI